MPADPNSKLTLNIIGLETQIASEIKKVRLFRPSYAVLNGNTHGNKPLSLKLSKLLKP